MVTLAYLGLAPASLLRPTKSARSSQVCGARGESGLLGELIESLAVIVCAVRRGYATWAQEELKRAAEERRTRGCRRTPHPGCMSEDDLYQTGSRGEHDHHLLVDHNGQYCKD
jgi:hypothetical protein